MVLTVRGFKKWLRRARRRVWAAWVSVQVELQGRYSFERFELFETYIDAVSSSRMLLLFLLTPFLCLLLGLLKELPPLASPQAGVYENWVFFVRSWFVLGFIGGSVLVQMGQIAPRLKLSFWQILFVAQLASTVGVGVGFSIGAWAVFPIPFGLLVVAPPDTIVIIACVIYISRDKWRADSSLWKDMKRQVSVFICQVALTFIYPLYIYGFVSFSGVEQTVFVIILPVIKIVAKNWISRALTNDDQKPETVIFNVEVFHALYVSTALQSASSWTSIALIMVVDILHFWESMLDVVEVLEGIKALMKKIPHKHPVAHENFVQIAMRLTIIETGMTTTSRTQSNSTRPLSTGRSRVDAWIDSPSSSKTSAAEREATLVRGGSNKIMSNIKNTAFVRAKVFPIRPPQRRELLQKKVVGIAAPNALQVVERALDTLGLETIFSRKERAVFLQKSMRLLFITEYLLLVEYVEVVLPFVYCLHRLALFHMHNGAYYPSLAGHSSAEIYSSVINVLAYGSLELASLVLAIMILKRTMGFSPVAQLAFVLEKQAGMIQSKLCLWTVYITQVSLEHLGADFSFKFEWLHKQ